MRIVQDQISETISKKGNYHGHAYNGSSSHESESESTTVNGIMNSGILSNGFWVKNEIESTTLLKLVALEAANDSHAPYRGCPSGVALMD